MGRTEKSQGLAPPAVRKDIRAKQARHIVNKVIPAILASNARARKGTEGGELIIDPGPVTRVEQRGKEGKEKEKGETGGEEGRYIKRKGQGRRKAKGGTGEDAAAGAVQSHGKAKGRRDGPAFEDDVDTAELSVAPAPPKSKIRMSIMVADTLTAALTLVPRNKKETNPCVLNMASPLRPGGGVLAGATSQEESLCARTTLLPSLKEEFYRLPEVGGVYSKDILVFRTQLPLGDAKGELPTPERYYIDVISAGMLRFPDLEGAEDEEKRLSQKDRAAVETKMRAVLRIACSKGVRKLVLGAWGCGAYGNPVRDVAEAWRGVLCPTRRTEAGSGNGVKGKGKNAQRGEVENWDGLQEVVFAISNAKMARDFAGAFGDGITVEGGPGGCEEEGDDETDEVAEELRSKISEMEGQIEKVWNADLKQRMLVILDGLKAQLKERDGKGSHFDVSGDSEGEGGEEDEEGSSEEMNEDEDEDEEVVNSGDDDQDGGLPLPRKKKEP